MIMFLLHGAFTFTSDLCPRVHRSFFLLQIRTGKVCQLRFPVFEIWISSLFGINANYRLNAAYYIFEKGYNLICIILDLKIRLTLAGIARNVAVPRMKKQISIFFCLTTAAPSLVFKIRPVFRIGHTTIYLLYKKIHTVYTLTSTANMELKSTLNQESSFLPIIRRPYKANLHNYKIKCCRSMFYINHFTEHVQYSRTAFAAYLQCANRTFVKVNGVNQVNKLKRRFVSFCVKYFLHVCKSLAVWL